MALTPETLPRHELVGLRVAVVDATDEGRVGTTGRVVGETMRTLTVAGADRVRQVPKAEATFAFELDDAEPETDEQGVVTVAGRRLVARPARRTETRGESTWR
jgi:ribonuclease P protein subunit POP4